MKTRTLFLLLFTIGYLAMGQTMSNSKKGMTKVAIMYPSGDDHTFDMDYYTSKHMPMVANLFGEPLRHWAIDMGVSGRTPEEPMTYVAIGYFYFDSIQAYGEAFGANAEKILGDIPNYTNIQPVVQISEVIK